MSQRQYIVIRLILCLAFFNGCQTGAYRLPGGSSLLGKKNNQGKVKQDVEESKTAEEQLAEQNKKDPKAVSPAKNDQPEPQKEDNPFIAYLQKNQGAKPTPGEVTPASGKTESTQKNLITPASINSSGGQGIHDAKTMMLIEAELRDMPPEQQQEMKKLLAGLPAEQVPQILKIRKLLAQQQASTPGKTPQLTQRPQERPSAYSSNINNVSPWSQPILTPKGPELLGIEDAYEMKNLGTENPENARLQLNNLPTINAGWNPNENPLMGNAQPPISGSLPAHPLNPETNQFSQNNILAPQVTTNQPQDLSLNSPVQMGTANQLNNSNFNNSMQPPSMNVSLNQRTSRWKDDLQKLIASAEVEFSQIRPGASDAEKLDYVSKQVYLRMLYLMGDQKGRATQAIADLSPSDQEFWQQTMWAFHNYFDQQGIPQEADRANQVIAQLQSAIGSLQNKAQLEIRNVNFCQKITSFGNYDAFPRQEFQPGEPVLIYAEIRNFSTEPTADGQHRTTLKSIIEVHKVGPQGGLVSQYDFPATVDTCKNRRQDYFHSYMINIPDKSTVGPHILKLTIEDQISHKVNTYSINFNVK